MFTKELGTTVGIEGQEVSMVCKATGLPDPHYEFYRVCASFIVHMHWISLPVSYSSQHLK